MPIGAWVWFALAAGSSVSLVSGHPWTSFLSAGRYPDEVRAHPWFSEANRVITATWTAYFALAGLATARTGWSMAIAFSVPTPLLGWTSFRVGDRYGSWKTRRSNPKENTAMATAAQTELRAQISGKTDDEILNLMLETPGGCEAVLDGTMAGMAETFDPDAAQDCVIGYEIDATTHTYAYRIEVRGKDVRAEQRAPNDARVVLQLSVPEYLRLITGLLDGTNAFMSGRMKIRGDVMFAPQIARMFRTA